MLEQSIHTFELPGGTMLLVEHLNHVQSVAFSISVPAGVSYEPDGANGTAAVACDLMIRGAGSRTSRELANALDFLGVQRHESVGWNFLSFSGSMLADKLPEALSIYADILLRPQLPEEHFPAVMSGVQQTLLAIEDEPQRKVFSELRKRCYDMPWGRSSSGSLEDLENISHSRISNYVENLIRPNGTLIGVAGNVDPNAIYEHLLALFGEWETRQEPTITTVPRSNENSHIQHDSTQTHIGIAYDSVTYANDEYYTAWAATSILSGGSSSRLFTEVREKRGLCYSVYASTDSRANEGRVLAYAGTTTERAQETFDVMLAEMKRLNEGIEEDELNRTLARAKSSLIMQQESTSSRASSLVTDWFYHRRIRPLTEIRSRLESITVDQIVDFVNRHPAKDITVLTVGAEPLNIPDEA